MIKIKFLLCLIILLYNFTHVSLSIENKIIAKVDKKIITSIDIENESKYLVTLNQSLKDLSKNEILNISKKSIIREKIKEIEISKTFNKPNIPEAYLKMLLKNIYQKLGIQNQNEFKKYLINNGIEYEKVIKKIEIEALWNELIVLKFKSKIKINENEIRDNIINRKKKISKSYLLSEIFFEVSNSEDLPTIFSKIEDSIKTKGFNNAALTYSISNTANVGGTLGWINENSLNKKLKKILSNIKEKQHTKPITVPGGFLILKISKIKEIEKKINLEEEIKKIINLRKNEQFSQFSKIYFNRVKKNMQINEI